MYKYYKKSKIVFLYVRRGVTCGDPKFIHGAEAFNGHVNHVNNNALALDFCEKNNLIKLCGTDFHDPSQPKPCYALIPEDISTEKELCAYIKSGKLEFVGDEEEYRRFCKKK